jgi:hypothetical protein
VSYDEVDLSDAIEHKLQESRAVTPVIGRPDLEFKIAQFGVEKGKELRIGKEDVDIVALAVIDLEHHGGAAAERPGIDKNLFGIDLLYHRTGDAEEARPV